MSKENIIEILKSFGIALPSFLAGVSGGITLLGKRKNLTFSQKVIIVLSGGLSANYLTPIFVHTLGFNENLQFGLAFLIGYSGMKLVELFSRKLAEKLTAVIVEDKQKPEQNGE